MTNIRTRFAPSPTGLLHIGGARTALFNYLFARHHGGSFLLRLEDTDQQRSQKKYAEKILEDLRWLGLCWDGKEVVQSAKFQRYQEVIRLLEEKDKIYPCFCTPQELEKEREEARRRKVNFRYSQKCRYLSREEVRKKKKSLPFCYRLKVGDSPVAFEDLIRGKVSFSADALDDFILVRSNGMPVYHLTVVVDDLDMQISHVIRGEDHLSNTPKQLLIYEALGKEPPIFAHLPMILDEKGQRMSKRLGALSIESFRKRGILPEALVNFLARLGWAYDDRQEIFELSELIEKFSLSGISRSAASFSEEKLLWLNQHYILHPELLKNAAFESRQDPDFELIDRLNDFYSRRYAQLFEKPKIRQLVLQLLKPRMKQLADAAAFLDPLVQRADGSEVALDAQIKLRVKQVKVVLESIAESRFHAEEIARAIKNFAEKNELKLGQIYQPLRLILTGRKVSFPMPELMEILGKGEVLQRIESFKALRN